MKAKENKCRCNFLYSIKGDFFLFIHFVQNDQICIIMKMSSGSQAGAGMFISDPMTKNRKNPQRSATLCSYSINYVDKTRPVSEQLEFISRFRSPGIRKRKVSSPMIRNPENTLWNFPPGESEKHNLFQFHSANNIRLIHSIFVYSIS